MVTQLETRFSTSLYRHVTGLHLLWFKHILYLSFRYGWSDSLLLHNATMHPGVNTTEKYNSLNFSIWCWIQFIKLSNKSFKVISTCIKSPITGKFCGTTCYIYTKYNFLPQGFIFSSFKLFVVLEKYIECVCNTKKVKICGNLQKFHFHLYCKTNI